MFATRDVGNNLLDHYVQRLEGSRGDALAAYETVWVCDQVCEDVAARCAAAAAQPPAARGKGRGATGAADDAAALLVHLSDAKVAVLDTAYEAVDIMISQLDRRARLLDAIVREQGACRNVTGINIATHTHTPTPPPPPPQQKHGWWMWGYEHLGR